MIQRALAGFLFLSVVIVSAAGGCSSGGGQECFAATTCLDKCGGKIVKSGCDVKCEAPLVDQTTCFGGADSGGDSSSDSASDAPNEGG